MKGLWAAHETTAYESSALELFLLQHDPHDDDDISDEEEPISIGRDNYIPSSAKENDVPMLDMSELNDAILQVKFKDGDTISRSSKRSFRSKYSSR